MKHLSCAAGVLLALFLVAGDSPRALGQGKGKAATALQWAYPVPDPNPAATPDPGPKSLPGSSLSLTQTQIDNSYGPPDWFPNEHAPLPAVTANGIQVQACILCHLPSGSGHPESADIAGLPYEYMVRQMADFKNGLRKDAPGYESAQRASRMNIISSGTPDDQMREALRYFAALKPQDWYDVVEADMVPRSWVTGGRMRLPHPDGGMEPIGKRIVTLPKDPERVEMRDPHSGFIAYVPPGSLARGKDLAENGGSGKTVACTVCHGEDLKGLGDIPRLAGVHPIYIMRQLYNFKTNANSSSFGAQMRKVVENLTEDDMIALAAYVASLNP